MPIKYHTVGLTSGRCLSSQELSEIGTPCHLTKPARTHKPHRLLLSFNLFLSYSDARLPLMHSTYLNHCMIFDTTKEAVNRQKQKCGTKYIILDKIVYIVYRMHQIDYISQVSIVAHGLLFPNFTNISSLSMGPMSTSLQLFT